MDLKVNLLERNWQRESEENSKEDPEYRDTPGLSQDTLQEPGQCTRTSKSILYAHEVQQGLANSASSTGEYTSYLCQDSLDIPKEFPTESSGQVKSRLSATRI